MAPDAASARARSDALMARMQAQAAFALASNAAAGEPSARAVRQAATWQGATVRSIEAAQAGVRSLSPALASREHCAELQEALGLLHERDGIDLETYRHLSDAVMRHADALASAPPPPDTAQRAQARGAALAMIDRVVLLGGVPARAAADGAMVLHGLDGDADRELMQARAHRIEQTGARPASPQRWIDSRATVRQAMHDGASAEEAVTEARVRHRMAHADDVADLRGLASELAAGPVQTDLGPPDAWSGR